jgi:hypothetical protein
VHVLLRCILLLLFPLPLALFLHISPACEVYGKGQGRVRFRPDCITIHVKAVLGPAQSLFTIAALVTERIRRNTTSAPPSRTKRLDPRGKAGAARTDCAHAFLPQRLPLSFLPPVLEHLPDRRPLVFFLATIQYVMP